MPFETTLDLLTLRRDGVEESQWPRLSCSQAQQAALAVGDLRLDAGREVLFQDQGQIRSFDDTHKLVFNRAGNLLELHEQGDIRFLTGGPVPSERLRLLATGQVGLGTATPTQALEVVGTVKATAFQGDGAELTGINTTDATKVAKAGDTMTGALMITAAGTGLRVTQNAVVGGTMTIAGNVGIGTTTPGAPLHVAQYMTVGPFAATTGQGGIDVVGPLAELGFVRRSLTAWPANPVAGDRFVWYNPDGTARLWTEQRGDLLTVTSLGNVGIGTASPRTPLHTLGRISTGQDFTSAGAITFFPPDGAAWFHIDNGPAGGRPTGRLRFSYGVNPGDFEVISMVQTGNVGIGTSAPAAKLHVRGARIRLEKAGTNQVLDLRADGGALDIESAGADLYLNNNNLPVRIRNLIQGSSREWKEDIADLPLEAAMEILDHLHPISFAFKEDASRQHHLGFVAEELPAIVTTPDQKGFSPMAIIAVLTKVVKQQQEQLAIFHTEMVRLKDKAE